MINIQITIEWIHKLNNMKVDKKLYLFVKIAIVWYLHKLELSWTTDPAEMFVRIVLHQTWSPAHFLHPQYPSTVVPEDIYIVYLVLSIMYYRRCDVR